MVRGSLERMRVRKEGVLQFLNTHLFLKFWCILDPYTMFIHVETNNKLFLEIKVCLIKNLIYSKLVLFFGIKNKIKF
jgi:hypothetical protein